MLTTMARLGMREPFEDALVEVDDLGDRSSWRQAIWKVGEFSKTGLG